MKTYCASFTAGLLTLLVGFSGLAQDAPKSKVAKEDSAHLSFGKVVETATQEKLDWKNPYRGRAAENA